MCSNLLPVRPHVPGTVVLASTALLAVLALNAAVSAQATSTFEGPACYGPRIDTWPVAATDPLGNTTSPLPVSFTGAFLLANDTGTSLSLVTVASQSSNGGRITGTNPYVYTPAARFVGTDVFTYQIRNGKGESTVGLVKVTVNPDLAPPTISITSPAGGTVSGVITITAAAADNVKVAGVRFFDGPTQIGSEDTTAPFSKAWDSRLAAGGSHSLTAVARDAAGNRTQSTPVVVSVVNTPTGGQP